jgi:hypothetical protein
MQQDTTEQPNGFIQSIQNSIFSMASNIYQRIWGEENSEGEALNRPLSSESSRNYSSFTGIRVLTESMGEENIESEEKTPSSVILQVEDSYASVEDAETNQVETNNLTEETSINLCNNVFSFFSNCCDSFLRSVCEPDINSKWRAFIFGAIVFTIVMIDPPFTSTDIVGNMLIGILACIPVWICCFGTNEILECCDITSLCDYLDNHYRSIAPYLPPPDSPRTQLRRITDVNIRIAHQDAAQGALLASMQWR